MNRLSAALLGVALALVPSLALAQTLGPQPSSSGSSGITANSTTCTSCTANGLLYSDGTKVQSATGALYTDPGQLTLATGTITASAPSIIATQTWNKQRCCVHRIADEHHADG